MSRRDMTHTLSLMTPLALWLVSLTGCAATPGTCGEGYTPDAEGLCQPIDDDDLQDGGGSADSGDAGGDAGGDGGDGDSGDGDSGDGDSGDSGDGSGGGDGAGGDGGVHYEAPGPSWDAAEVTAHFAAALSYPVGDPLALDDVYTAMFGGRSNNCPDTQDYTMPVDHEGCEADSGWYYAGPTVYNFYEDPGLYSVYIWNDCEIIDGDGERYIGAGTASYNAFLEDGGVESWSVKLGGIFGYPPAGAWLGESPSLSMEIEGSYDGQDYSLWMQGGQTIGGYSYFFEDVTISSDLCPGGLGVVWLRDVNAYWYQVVLAEDCSGCGPLVYDAREDLGEICPALPTAATDLAARLRDRPGSDP